MFVIIWSYLVKPAELPDFEKIYSGNGAWAKLFSKSEGYRGTELLQDEADPHHMMTIDRWESEQGYAEFMANWRKEYDALDALCEGMTEQEILMGRFFTAT
ncbi:MAG: antibiotic biosynthesis monooxygenase [Chloroflexi bacterium]|nr:antibiotic biosynthesis monooxygenase [Chloroflexota bacterium]